MSSTREQYNQVPDDVRDQNNRSGRGGSRHGTADDRTEIPTESPRRNTANPAERLKTSSGSYAGRVRRGQS